MGDVTPRPGEVFQQQVEVVDRLLDLVAGDLIGLRCVDSADRGGIGGRKAPW